MKNLIAKAGVIAASSVLLTTAVSVKDAQALTLGASSVNSLYYATNGVGNNNNTSQLYPTPGEIGEFVFGEVRTYAEYDLTPFAQIWADDLANGTDAFNNLDFDLGFNIASLIGSGAVGSNLGGASDASPYTGTVNVLWYLGSAVGDPLLFNPTTPNLFNPLYSFEMSGLNVGDRINLDTATVSNLVRYLITVRGLNSFGIMLKTEIASVGACGPINVSIRENCSGAIFDNFDVAIPTPAAVLPTIFGFVSAALRKKKQEEEALEA